MGHTYENNEGPTLHLKCIAPTSSLIVTAKLQCSCGCSIITRLIQRNRQAFDAYVIDAFPLAAKLKGQDWDKIMTVKSPESYVLGPTQAPPFESLTGE